MKTDPARAGVILFALDMDRVAEFHVQLLGMVRIHRDGDVCVVQNPDLQLVVHAIPPAYAQGIVLTTPPTPREDTALKFFATVHSLAAARVAAPGLGGRVEDQTWEGPGFRACNAIDPEGNILQLREATG